MADLYSLKDPSIARKIIARLDDPQKSTAMRERNKPTFTPTETLAGLDELRTGKVLISLVAYRMNKATLPPNL
jgi:hypothetical protein